MSATLISGANDVQVEAGLSVRTARGLNAETLNVSAGAEVRLNGQRVDNDYVIQDGDVIEFIKPSGEKG